MKPDIVYRLGPRGKNDPLRYSLRSLSNLAHGAVHVIGHVPAWLHNVDVLTPGRYHNKWRGLVIDLYQACIQLPGTRFVLIDDDTYIMQPIKAVKTLHAGDMLLQAGHKGGPYGRTIRWTCEWLETHGVEPEYSYELHVPMPIDADACAAALEPALNASRAVQARSIYGNTARIGGTYAEDVKVKDVPAGPYLSTSPVSFRALRPMLDARFPMRSEYE